MNMLRIEQKSTISSQVTSFNDKAARQRQSIRQYWTIVTHFHMKLDRLF